MGGGVIPVWVAVAVALVHLYLGVWLGVWLAKRERKRDTRIDGPWLDDDDVAQLKKGGWL